MTDRGRTCRLLVSLLAVTALFAASDIARAQTSDGTDLSIELVDPKVLRVCADPRNMPFSNDKSEGFENKIAELLAQKLGKSLAYTWYPQCNDVVQSTNPYYRTAYALVLKPGNGLDDVDTLADPRLKGKHIGIVAG